MDWGKAKYDYYYTDYVDKDYPSKLTAKEERLASIEQEEALRMQKILLSTLEDVDWHEVYDATECAEEPESILKRLNDDQDEGNHNDDRDQDEEDEDEDDVEDEEEEDEEEKAHLGRQRRPINIAIRKNRGLTPYKKKEYRNPRVKHKLKYKKAISKRRRLVREVLPQLQRYSGEATGIKTSTIKSIKLS